MNRHEMLLTIHHRGELRRKLIDLDNATCANCREDKKRERIWLMILEKILYKKRRNDSPLVDYIVGLCYWCIYFI